MRNDTRSHLLACLPWLTFALTLTAGCAAACADGPPPDSPDGGAPRSPAAAAHDGGGADEEGVGDAAPDAAVPAALESVVDGGVARPPEPVAHRLPAVMEKRLEGVVNVNAASPEELRMLSGIGPAKIRAIMLYRQSHPFRTVEELVRIKGIGRKMVRRLRMHLAVSGPTTAQQVIRPSAEVTLPPPGSAAVGRSAPHPVVAAAAQAPAPAPAPPDPAGKTATRGAPGAGRAGRAGRSQRALVPGVVFPDATANHCPRPR